MKTLPSLILAVVIGSAGLLTQPLLAATKKKPTDKTPATNTDTKPPIDTNETWSPKVNRQPVPSKTPVTDKTPVPTKTPATTAKTPAPKKSVTPGKTLTLGDKLKSKIVSNPQPKLPDAARKANVSGPVRVEVTLDEKGNVLSAKPLSGNTLLQPAAVDSARKAKFKPTLLSGTPVKVTGIITYNFVLQ